MPDRFRFLLSRLRERLWVKPLIACVLSVAGVLLAHMTDQISLGTTLPDVSRESIIELLQIIATSMFAVSTFAVASMVSAYASAGQTATARAFPLIVADDVSQNALSIFISAFIFSIVGISAIMNGYYGRAGRFTLFALMLLVLVIVVLTFVRWVDRIARLGRVSSIISKVEEATMEALLRSRTNPRLGGVAPSGPESGIPLRAKDCGYLQSINVATLQKQADRCGVRVRVKLLPGAYVSPGQTLGYIHAESSRQAPPVDAFEEAFIIGKRRHFDDDPGFGLLALSEIASRALSPGVNDPGTAIEVLGAVQRLFTAAAAEHHVQEPGCKLVSAPELNTGDLFDDAFNAIARDGASVVEVALRLQELLGELGEGGPEFRSAARQHADLALARAEHVLDFGRDLAQVRARHAQYWGTED